MSMHLTRASCIGVEVQNCTHGRRVCTGEMNFSGPTIHPTCQPVTEKVLPALDMVMVRSHMSAHCLFVCLLKSRVDKLVYLMRCMCGMYM